MCGTAPLSLTSRARASKSNDIESLNYRLIPANTIYDLYTVRAHTASIDIYIYIHCVYIHACCGLCRFSKTSVTRIGTHRFVSRRESGYSDREIAEVRQTEMSYG